MRRTAFALAALSALAPAAADWPRFRGPNGAGVADAPASLFAADPQAATWTAALPAGYSSPVVAGGKVFVTSAAADGSARTLHALDAATGKPLWAAARPGQASRTHKKNSLATGTPAADDKHVYIVVWDGRAVSLVAYTHAGAEAWAAELGGFDSQHGPGISPVAHAGKVFVNLDQDGDAKLLAFDAATGSRAWAAERKAFKACYTSPTVRDLPGGKSEVVVTSTAGLAGHDPATGAVNWTWDWQFGGAPLRAVAAPVVVGDTVIAAAGDGGGSRSLVCIKPGAKPELVWEKRRDTPYVPSPLAHDGHLYWVTDAGVAACADPKTGRVLWSERAFNTAVSASPVLAGGVIFAVAESGQAAAFKATPAGFEKVHESRLPGVSIATPAIADGRLFARAGGTLYCWAAGK